MEYRSCFQYIKGTKKKANHNLNTANASPPSVVSNTSKVLKRKQITTSKKQCTLPVSCFQYIKGTKKKANHNPLYVHTGATSVVSNTSKVLKRKQITTKLNKTFFLSCCFQYIKGTKKKANHNHCRAVCFLKKLFPIHQRY